MATSVAAAAAEWLKVDAAASAGAATVVDVSPGQPARRRCGSFVAGACGRTHALAAVVAIRIHPGNGNSSSLSASVCLAVSALLCEQDIMQDIMQDRDWSEGGRIAPFKDELRNAAAAEEFIPFLCIRSPTVMNDHVSWEFERERVPEMEC